MFFLSTYLSSFVRSLFTSCKWSVCRFEGGTFRSIKMFEGSPSSFLFSSSRCSRWTQSSGCKDTLSFVSRRCPGRLFLGFYRLFTSDPMWHPVNSYRRLCPRPERERVMSTRGPGTRRTLPSTSSDPRLEIFD